MLQDTAVSIMKRRCGVILVSSFIIGSTTFLCCIAKGSCNNDPWLNHTDRIDTCLTAKLFTSQLKVRDVAVRSSKASLITCPVYSS
ncbi:hypothetical protein TNCV_525321 [Trichonephila clavipes]|nr:hypothetical protein TNCV_525321 [Trichonephila clavipes]